MSRLSNILRKQKITQNYSLRGVHTTMSLYTKPNINKTSQKKDIHEYMYEDCSLILVICLITFSVDYQ